MSLTATILAFASGLAARVREPKREINADVEITRLREELNEARRDVDALRLAMMRLIEERRSETRVVAAPQVLREVVDCTGGGRYAHLAGLQQQMAGQQQHLAQQYSQMAAMNAQNAMAAQVYPFQNLGLLGQQAMNGLGPLNR